MVFCVFVVKLSVWGSFLSPLQSYNNFLDLPNFFELFFKKNAFRPDFSQSQVAVAGIHYSI